MAKRAAAGAAGGADAAAAAKRQRKEALELADGVNHQDIPRGQEGYVIVSRWGRVLHRVGCTCAPCKARRNRGEVPICGAAKPKRARSSAPAKAKAPAPTRSAADASRGGAGAATTAGRNGKQPQKQPSPSPRRSRERAASALAPAGSGARGGGAATERAPRAGAQPASQRRAGGAGESPKPRAPKPSVSDGGAAVAAAAAAASSPSAFPAGKRGIHKASCSCVICRTRAEKARRDAAGEVRPPALRRPRVRQRGAGGTASPRRSKADRERKERSDAVSTAAAALGVSPYEDPLQAVAAAELASALADTQARAHTAEAAEAVIMRLQAVGALDGEVVEYRTPVPPRGLGMGDAAGAVRARPLHPPRGTLEAGGGVRCPCARCATRAAAVAAGGGASAGGGNGIGGGIGGVVSLAEMAAHCGGGLGDKRHCVDSLYLSASGISLRQHVANMRAVASNGGAHSPQVPPGDGSGGSGAAASGTPLRLATPRPTAQGNSSRRDPFVESVGSDIAENEQLRYVDCTSGRTLLEGCRRGIGILCGCCSRIVTPSTFEAHAHTRAGGARLRAAYDCIICEDGRSLRQVVADRERRLGKSGTGAAAAASAAAARARAPVRGARSGSRSRGRPRKDRQAAGKVSDGKSLPGLVERCRRLAADLDIVQGGCVLCRASDFDLDSFGPRTMMVCDQCEREFHVGCLSRFGRADLKALPEGEWFCSADCAAISASLQAQVEADVGTQSVLPGDSRWAEHTFTVLRGTSDAGEAGALAPNPAREKILSAALRIITSSFDPITDLSSGKDLLPLMVYSRSLSDHDFTNMMCFVVSHRGKPVCAATVRVFGRRLAEMPLVATDVRARRQGHCRALVLAVERVLAAAGVEKLGLPAAPTAVGTWVHGFGFSEMSLEERKFARSELRMMHFPGSTLLAKDVRMPQPVAASPMPNKTLLGASGGASGARPASARAHAHAEPQPVDSDSDGHYSDAETDPEGDSSGGSLVGWGDDPSFRSADAPSDTDGSDDDY